MKKRSEETEDKKRGSVGSSEEGEEMPCFCAYLPHYLKINDLRKKRHFCPWKYLIFLTI